MVKVGDKFRVVSTDEYEGDKIKAGCILEFSKQSHPLGFMATDTDGILWYVKTKDMTGSSGIIVEKITTQTEAERRGAKFGVMGVGKITGRKIRFVTDDGKKSLNGQPLWVFLNEETQSIMRIRPSDVRFDHEPEFVAWSEAPEHLRYDASRVYYEGEPVKWIAKPEGAFVDVAVVLEDGTMEFSTHGLTVKL